MIPSIDRKTLLTINPHGLLLWLRNQVAADRPGGVAADPEELAFDAEPYNDGEWSISWATGFGEGGRVRLPGAPMSEDAAMRSVASVSPFPVLLLNTTIATGIPAAGEPSAVYRLSAPVSAEDARRALVACEVESAIGHQATADAMTALLGQPVPMNRSFAKQAPGQRALVLKVRGRLPEGVILDREALEAIGYDLLWMTRVE